LVLGLYPAPLTRCSVVVEAESKRGLDINLLPDGSKVGLSTKGLVAGSTLSATGERYICKEEADNGKEEAVLLPQGTWQESPLSYAAQTSEVGRKHICNKKQIKEWFGR